MNWPARKKSHYRYPQLNVPLEDKVKQIEGYSSAPLIGVLIQLASVNQEIEFSYGEAIIHISETHHVLLDLNLEQCLRPYSWTQIKPKESTISAQIF